MQVQKVKKRQDPRQGLREMPQKKLKKLIKEVKLIPVVLVLILSTNQIHICVLNAEKKFPGDENTTRNGIGYKSKRMCQ